MPAWDRRGTVVLACAALCAIILLAYAGTWWPIVVYRLITDGVLALVWIVAAYGIGALVPLPGRSPEFAPLCIVTRVAIGLGAIGLITLGLGLAGAMNRVAALVLLGVGVAVVMWRLLRARAASPAFIRAWWNARAGWAWLWALAMPLFAMSLVAALVPPGLLWGDEPNGYDVVEYHLQVPREWYEAGRIMPLEHNVFSYFPFNVEMQFLLAMHVRGGPWAGMYLAQLMHVAYVALSVAAVYAVAKSLGGNGTVAGVAAGATPWLALLAPVAYNEGGLLLYGTLAIGWTLLALRDSGRVVASMAVAGAMAGLACGVKLTAVPMLLLPLPVALVAIAIARREPLRRAFIAAVACGVVGVAVFSPWLVRNAVWTGNPVFPEAQEMMGRGHFSDVQTQRWQAAHSPRADQRAISARIAAAWEQIARDARYGYLLLPLALAWSALAYRRPETWLLLGMLVVLVVIWAGFTHLQGRFFVLAIPVAALLVAQAVDRCATIGAGVIVVLLAIAGFATMHPRLTSWLHEKQVVEFLGFERIEQLTPTIAREAPEDATLVLAGDAKAFLYQRPMKRLRYRTVFDVGPEPDWLRAWAGDMPATDAPGAVVVVDPNELRRFARTYAGLPDVPAELLERDGPFVLERGRE